MALALIGLVLTVFLSALALGNRGSDNLAHKSTALQLARSQIESIKGQPYAEPIAYRPVPLPSDDFSVDISGLILQPGSLQEVRVVVTYPEGSLELSAYKAKDVPPPPCSPSSRSQRLPPSRPRMTTPANPTRTPVSLTRTPANPTRTPASLSTTMSPTRGIAEGAGDDGPLDQAP